MTGDAKVIDLKAIREREKSATPGPWRECGHDRDGCPCGFVWSLPSDALVATSNGPNSSGDVPTPDDAHRRSNARFIASAREDVPALLDLVDEPLEQHRALAEIAQEMINVVQNGGAFDNMITVGYLSLNAHGWQLAVSILALRMASR